jgi:hypothetical protein
MDPAARDEAEAFLAEQAAELRPEQLKLLADRKAVELNPDGAFTDADRTRQAGFAWGPQHRNGMRRGVLWATPELQAHMEASLAQDAKPGMNNPADQTPCTDGEPDPQAAARDTRSPAQRNHDALAATFRRQLGDPKRGVHRGLPVTVIASATLAELEAAAGVAVTAGGTLLPMADLIRMASHAIHYLVIFDDATGRPLWLGRARRCASADQRIVLHSLDRGCTFRAATNPVTSARSTTSTNGPPTVVPTSTNSPSPAGPTTNCSAWAGAPENSPTATPNGSRLPNSVSTFPAR